MNADGISADKPFGMTIKRISLLISILLLQLTAIAQQRLPNVIWIDLEDLSPILSMYGDSTIQTPNIDRLAREGVTFTNAYATVGVCAPSRASIITGMFPTSIGAHHMRITAPNAYAAQGVPEYEVVPPPGVRCFPDLLREKSIYTVRGNKTDHQFSPSPFTWDLAEKDTDSARNRFNYPQPFFKQIHFAETHESQIWARKNAPLLIDSSKVKVPPYLPKTPGTRRDWITQYNNLKFVDNKIGDILDALEKAGILQHTIIIFTGDHGNGLPRSKRTVYESGVKVPMIIRYPDKRMAGTRNKELAYLMDLGPTILSIYDIATPSYMHGQDLLGKYKPAKPRQHLFFSADRFDVSYDMIRAVSNGRFKYIRNFEPRKPQFMDVSYRKQQEGVQDLYRLDSLNQLNTYAQAVMRKTKPTEELFDFVNDPHELNNLAADPKYQSVRNALKLALDDWMQHISDMGFTPEKDIAASFWPGGKQPVTASPKINTQGEILSLSCPTVGATIGYKMNDQSGWSIYTKPFVVKKGDVVETKAHRLGYKTSEAVTLTIPVNR
jgi:N-sulfoglucosamine sulfohydrolase